MTKGTINGKHLTEVKRKWVNTELPKETAGRFKECLRDYHMNFETSEVGNMIHFEVLASEKEMEILNQFLDTL